MISNESQWGRPRQPQHQPYYPHPQYRDEPMPTRPPVHEDTLVTHEVQIERKHFLLALKENPRGRFLRITEEINGRFNSVMVPATGLHEFQKLLAEIVTANGEIPVKQPALP